ncbi:MAG TPA: helicase-related protein, partial [Polyangiaceae bacterium]|nr:helicase-related protein [Polyangiaceae bacterium]
MDRVTGDVVAAVARGAAVVVEASPGAGKTTRIPSALLDAVEGDIVVLEPRRLAARLAAARVAHERNEPLGKTVGYQVRFDKKASKDTRLSFVTEGVLTRRLMRDPLLDGVGAVVLDELHERHIHTDLALALLMELRKKRALALVAMSATLELAPVLELLDAQHVRCAVERHAVAIEYVTSKDPLDVQIAVAARRLQRDGVRGHILAFLPGTADIRRAAERCRALEMLVLPLHGSLSPAEQDAAVAPSAQQKLILATNVAETSITIEGVEAVIDSGLVKRASHSPWSGLVRLDVQSTSRASAAQRTGRAGRTGPGRCIRLYSARDHERMRAYEEPEIVRSDLSEAVLALRLAGITAPSALRWLTPPPPDALARAEALLTDLGADQHGRRMARFPVHPRLGRALVEAEERNAVDEVAEMAARLAEPGGPRAVERTTKQLIALSHARAAKTSDDA